MGHNLPDYKASADLPLKWGCCSLTTPGPDLRHLKKKKKMQIQTKQLAQIGPLALPLSITVLAIPQQKFIEVDWDVCDAHVIAL